ncbi:MAG: lytic transglycosylase domain-containing protein [Alphaproteobacteria bacterium]|nr:lytic transglycosylase domain-containing protein [Alphaproteobacteria bacterium]
MLGRLTFGALASGIAQPELRPPITLAADHSIDRWQPLIAEAAQRFGPPQPWIRAVMKAESGGRLTLDGAPITSPAGAMGLMQVMPETYTAMRARLGLGPDPYKPRDNIFAGTAYLADMYQRYGYPGLFAAYNAGPERFERYLQDGTPLPETVRYLARIGSDALATVLAMKGPSPSAGMQLAAADTSTRADFVSGRALFFVNEARARRASKPPNDAFSADQNQGPGDAIFVVRKGADGRSTNRFVDHLFVPLARNHP